MQKHTGLDAGENRIDCRPSPSPAPKQHLLEKLGASVSAAQHPQTPEAMTLARYLDIPSPNFSTFCFLSWCLPLPTIHYCSESTSQHMGTEAQCPWKDDKEGKGSLKPPPPRPRSRLSKAKRSHAGAQDRSQETSARAWLGGTSVATYMRAGTFWRQQRRDMMVSHTGGRTQEPQASISDEWAIKVWPRLPWSTQPLTGRKDNCLAHIDEPQTHHYSHVVYSRICRRCLKEMSQIHGRSRQQPLNSGGGHKGMDGLSTQQDLESS